MYLIRTQCGYCGRNCCCDDSVKQEGDLPMIHNMSIPFMKGELCSECFEKIATHMKQFYKKIALGKE